MTRERGGVRGRANLVLAAILAAVLAAAVLAMAGMLPGPGTADTHASSLRAIVHDADGNAHELPLDQDATLEVATDLGTNVVIVEDGAVRVAEADCAGLDCVHQGAIDLPGRQIICLPHKLWIEVVADGEAGGAMDVDAVADGSDDERPLDAVAR